MVIADAVEALLQGIGTGAGIEEHASPP